MADTMTREQRHRCMSRIRAKDTKPEMIVRRFLWAHGFRYRLHSSKLPGHPDIVLAKHKTIIFINGCFWHGHNATVLSDGELANSDCCKIPHTNRPFWLAKINRNRERDIENSALLKTKGWRIITIWECELKAKHRDDTLNRLLSLLRPIKPYSIDTPEIAIAAEESIPYRAAFDNSEG